MDTVLDPNVEYLCKVEGFPNYLVSSWGNVYRLGDRRFLRVKRKVNPDTGYVSVNLTNEEGQSTKLLHRIVAFAFCHNEKPEEWIVVDHLDTDKENCRADNLEWVTQSENVKRSWENTRHTEEYKSKKEAERNQ